MPIVITLAEKGGRPEIRSFAGEEVTIGRVDDNDIVLAKGNVSKRHARIVIRDDKAILVDMKSTNGTFVNGQRIGAPQVLKSTDKVNIGDYVLGVGEGADVSGEGAALPDQLDWIVTVDGPDGRQQFALMGDVTVGRSSTCDIPVNHKNVGRRQLRILPFSRYVAITDLGTALGTWVNGERISGSCRLSSSEDVVEFAAHRMWVHRPGEEPPTATGRPGVVEGAGWMLVIGGIGSPEVIAVGDEPLEVGSHASCRIPLRGPQIPERYLRFVVESGVLQVTELAASPAGVERNGERLVTAQATALAPGDQLKVAASLAISVQSALPIRPPPPRPEVTVPRHAVGGRASRGKKRKKRPGVPSRPPSTSASPSGTGDG